MDNAIPDFLLLMPFGDSKFFTENCSNVLLELCELNDNPPDTFQDARLVSMIRVLVEENIGEVALHLVRKFAWTRAHVHFIETQLDELIMTTAVHLATIMKAPQPKEARSLVVLTHLGTLAERAFVTLFTQVTAEFTTQKRVTLSLVKKLPPPEGIE